LYWIYWLVQEICFYENALYLIGGFGQLTALQKVNRSPSEIKQMIQARANIMLPR
jgi:hypothetical protein